MGKTVTLRVSQEVYELFRLLAKRDNRPISNFIETAALRYVEERQLAEESEMDEIAANSELGASLKRAYQDVEAARGRFV